MKASNQPNTSNDKPHTVEDIISAIQEKSADGGYIFRGESECYKRISSNLFRELDAINAQYSNIKKIEADIVAEAKAYTDKTDDSKIRDDLQHYGGKTNLIDFTTDYNVALFFTCYGSPTKSGRVIILQETEKIKEMLRYPKTPEIRVDAQKSVFVEPTKGYIEEKFEVIYIPKELKLLILQHLKEELIPEITPKTIYNDIHGFIRSQNTYWMVYRDFYNGLISENKGKKAKTLKEKQKASKEAIEHYTNALDKDLQLASVYNNRGNAYNNIEESDLAIADFDMAIQLDSNLVETYNNRGNAYGMKGEYHLAIADFNTAIQLKPDYPEAHNNRGNAYDKKGEYDLAIENFNAAIHLRQDYAEAHNNRGITYAHKNEYDLAIKDYNKAIEIENDYVNAYNNRGTAYKEKGDFNAAITNFNEAIRLTPDRVEAYVNRGNAYNNLDENDLAIKDFNTAIKLKDDSYEAYTGQGNYYRNIGQLDLAMKNYNKAIELNPYGAIIYNDRGIAHYDKGEYDLAIKDYNKAIKLKSDYPEAYMSLGNAYGTKGNFNCALANLDKAMQLKDNFAEAYNNRAALYAKNNHNDLKTILPNNTNLSMHMTSPRQYYNRAEVESL